MNFRFTQALFVLLTPLALCAMDNLPGFSSIFVQSLNTAPEMKSQLHCCRTCRHTALAVMTGQTTLLKKWLVKAGQEAFNCDGPVGPVAYAYAASHKIDHAGRVCGLLVKHSTSLSDAIRGGSFKYVVERATPENVNMLDGKNEHPLVTLFHSRNITFNPEALAILNHLLIKGANPLHLIDKENSVTVLQVYSVWTAQSGQMKPLDILLENGANPHFQFNNIKSQSCCTLIKHSIKKADKSEPYAPAVDALFKVHKCLKYLRNKPRNPRSSSAESFS